MVHDKVAPTDSEWQQVLMSTSAAHATDVRSIAISDGGAPTRAQQQLLREALKGRAAYTAVVSDAVAARFIISIIALFNAGIRGFSPSDWAKAVAWATSEPEVPTLLHGVIAEIAEQYPGKFALLEKIALTVRRGR